MVEILYDVYRNLTKQQVPIEFQEEYDRQWKANVIYTLADTICRIDNINRELALIQAEEYYGRFTNTSFK